MCIFVLISFMQTSFKSVSRQTVHPVFRNIEKKYKNKAGFLNCGSADDANCLLNSDYIIDRPKTRSNWNFQVL